MSAEHAKKPHRRSGDFDLLVYLVRRNWWLVALCVLGLPLCAVLVRRSHARANPTPAPTPGPAASLVTTPTPLDGTAPALQQQISRVIANSPFASARWGVCAVSLRDGRVVAAHNAQELMSPASTFKLYTTAVALDLLGAEYRWRTSVYAATAPDGEGNVNGDLTLYGRGAPDLSVLQLGQLADVLKQKGVRRVRGNVTGDETYFRADILGDGWLWNDVQWYFGAEVSALSVNGNEITVNATPGQTTLQPATDYVRVDNTIKRGSGVAALGVNRGLSDNQVRVWGATPTGQGVAVRLAVHQPALWAARIFREQLAARGIIVEGAAQMADGLATDDAQRFDPAKAVELASVTSASLGEIVRDTNKESLNLNAELILRTLGKEQGSLAPPPAPDKIDENHHDKRGLAVVRVWLQQKGIDAQRLALHDGSGLSRLDLVTPETSARMLTTIAQTPVYETFKASLPIAGRDGTLSRRLKSVTGRVFAKTGTLTHANALSGYALTANGDMLAFAIICNDDTAPASSSAVIDAIVNLLTQ